MSDAKVKRLKARLDAHPIAISDHAKERHLNPTGQISADRLASRKTTRIVDEGELRQTNSVFLSEQTMRICTDLINQIEYLPRMAAIWDRYTNDPDDISARAGFDIEIDLREKSGSQLLAQIDNGQLLCYTQNAESLRTRAHLASAVKIVLRPVPISADNRTGFEMKTMYPIVDKTFPPIGIRYAPEVFRRQRKYTGDHLKDQNYAHINDILVKKMHVVKAELANSRYANRIVEVKISPEGQAIEVVTIQRMKPSQATKNNEPHKALLVTTRIDGSNQRQNTFQFAMRTPKIESSQDGTPTLTFETQTLDEPVPLALQQSWEIRSKDFIVAAALASQGPFEPDDPTLDDKVDMLIKQWQQRSQQPKKTKRTPIANAPEPADHTDTRQYE